MADLLDDAQIAEQQTLRAALTRRRPEGPSARGYCLECGDEDVGGLRWCSAECARDWERRTNQHSIRR